MNNNLEKILESLGDKAKNVKMTDAEKAQRRSELMQFMQKAVNMPELHADKKLLSRNRFGWFANKMRAAYIAVPLTLAVGAGVVFAAQNSLPGDPLYGVKVNVLEKAQTALAVSPEQKADLEATFAVRRLQEAEALKKQNRLTPELSHEVAGKFDENSKAFKRDVEALKSQNEDNKASEINANFDRSVSVHHEVLDALKARSDGGAGQDQNGQDQNRNDRGVPPVKTTETSVQLSSEHQSQFQTLTQEQTSQQSSTLQDFSAGTHVSLSQTITDQVKTDSTRDQSSQETAAAETSLR